MLNQQQIKALALMYTQANEKALLEEQSSKEHEYIGYRKAILDIALLLNGGNEECMRKQLFISGLKIEKQPFE